MRQRYGGWGAPKSASKFLDGKFLDGPSLIRSKFSVRTGVTAIRAISCCFGTSASGATGRRPPGRALAQAAEAPGQAAAGATAAARAAKNSDSEPAAAAASASATAPASAATMAAAASVATAATMTTAAASAGDLHAATANVFPVEQIERSEVDVGHLLFAENEAMVGQALVGLRDIGARHRRCRGATGQ